MITTDGWLVSFSCWLDTVLENLISPVAGCISSVQNPWWLARWNVTRFLVFFEDGTARLRAKNMLRGARRDRSNGGKLSCFFASVFRCELIARSPHSIRARSSWSDFIHKLCSDLSVVVSVSRTAHARTGCIFSLMNLCRTPSDSPDRGSNEMYSPTQPPHLSVCWREKKAANRPTVTRSPAGKFAEPSALRGQQSTSVQG